MDDTNRKSIEETINSLHNVISSKVVMEQGEIVEIHVLADNSRNAKQISRDIQSAVLTRFDVELDHKKISVAQIDFEHDFGKSDRPEINTIQYAVAGNEIEFTVELGLHGTTAVGSAKGSNTRRNGCRLLAKAAVACLHSMFNLENLFVIESVKEVVLAEKDVVIVGVSLVSKGRELFLVGSAVVRRDEQEAIVRAVLDAVNRKLVEFNK